MVHGFYFLERYSAYEAFHMLHCIKTVDCCGFFILSFSVGSFSGLTLLAG